jgi:hypothetical protein
MEPEHTQVSIFHRYWSCHGRCLDFPDDEENHVINCLIAMILAWLENTIMIAVDGEVSITNCLPVTLS